MNGLLQVAKETFDGLPMQCSGIVHELRELIDRERNVRSCDGEVLECTNSVAIECEVITGITIKNREVSRGGHG